MSKCCPNCDALCAICQDNTWDSSETLCNPCRLAIAHERQRIIKLLEDEMNRLEGWTDYPAVNALMTIRAALIKGEK